jgi:hypothetical protein
MASHEVSNARVLYGIVLDSCVMHVATGLSGSSIQRPGLSQRDSIVWQADLSAPAVLRLRKYLFCYLFCRIPRPSTALPGDATLGTHRPFCLQLPALPALILLHACTLLSDLESISPRCGRQVGFLTLPVFSSARERLPQIEAPVSCHVVPPSLTQCPTSPADSSSLEVEP